MVSTIVGKYEGSQINTGVTGTADLIEKLGMAAVKSGEQIDQLGRAEGPRKAGAGAADAQKKMTGLGGAATRATGAIRTGFNNAVGGIRSFTGSLGGVSTSIFNVRSAAVGLVGAFSFGAVISELRGFEATMAQVQGVTRATGGEFDQLQGLARDLGRNTRFSGQEAAEGILFLARAGQDTNTIMQTLPPTLKFAQAGAIALGDAANFATNIMGGFQLGAEQTEQALNALVTVANNANTDVTSLASAMSFVGPAANAAGVSLETTAAAIGVLGDVGIDASKAGTSLRQILINLANTDPPDRVVAALESLGLTIDDVNPKTVGLEQAFQNLREAGVDLTTATQLVGAEASSAFLALAEGGEKIGELSELARTTTDSLDVMSDAMSITLDDAIKRAQSAFAGLIQEIGARGTTSILTQAFDGIGNAINFVTDNLDLLAAPIGAVISAFSNLVNAAIVTGQALIAAFGPLVTGVFTTISGAVGTLGITFDALQAPLQGIIAAFTVLIGLQVATFFVSTGAALVKSFGNPVGLAIAAVGALAGILLDLSGVTLPGVIRAVAGFVDGLIGTFRGLGRAVAAAFSNLGPLIVTPFLNAFDSLGQLVEDFLNTLIEQFNKVGEIVGLSIDPVNIITPTVREGFSDAARDVSLAFVQGLNFTGASDAVEPILQSLEQIGPTTQAATDEANIGITETEDALVDLGEAADVAANQTSTTIGEAASSFEDLGDAAVSATSDTVTGITAADDRLIQLNDTIGSTGTAARRAFAEGEEAAASFNDRVRTVADTFGDVFEAFDINARGFARNAERLANSLGVSLGNAFTGIADSLGVTTTEIGGFFGLIGEGLDIFGIEIDRIIGEDATEAIQRFASLSSAEIEVLGNAFSGLVGLFGSGTQQVQAFGEATAVTFPTLATTVGSLDGAVAGLNEGLGNTSGGLSALGSEAEFSTGQLIAFAGAAAAVAGGITAIAGASADVQAGASVGAGIGALIGGAVGGPGGAAAGSVAGGIFGGFIGDALGLNRRAERRAEERRLRELGEDIGSAIRDGFVAGLGDLAADLSSDELRATIQALTADIGILNDALSDTADLVDVDGQQGGGGGIPASEFAVEALGSSAATAAAAISDEFQINLADVVAFFNALPEDTADSFAQLEANAQFIAEQLAVQFGIGVDEALALIDQLINQSVAAFADIDDPVEFLAAKLADSFDVSVDQILAVLGELPPGALDSFSDLANNAELIARNIAVTLGVTFEEALAIVQEFARQAGVDISDVGTSARDVGNQIVDGFSGTEANLTNIFFQLASLGSEAFENIRTNADGSLRLADEQAQRRLESIVAAFGGTEEDIQLILRSLAENSDIAFTDIFTSGAFAFGNLSEEAEAKIRGILEELGFTAVEIAVLFSNINQLGIDAFDGVEQSAAAATASILQSFGLTDAEIEAILTSIAENGQISFSDLEGASGEALRQILENFGLAEEQINFILDALAGNGAQSFADLAFAALSAAGGITEDFLAAFRAIIAGFEDLEGSGEDTFDELTGLGQTSAAAVQSSFTTATTASASAFQSFASSAGGAISALGGQAAATASAISGSFAAAAGSAAGSFSAIVSQARSAQAAIRAVRAPTLGPAAAFADGGIIEGPTLLGGAAAGQAFQFGGVLPGLTSLFGPVTPTAEAGIAGERGTEFIVPAARMSDGDLGIKAVAPPTANTNAQPVVVQQFTIDARGAGDETIRMLTEMVERTRREVPEVAAQTAARMMRNSVRL